MKNLKDYGFKTKNSTYVIAEIGINHNGCMKTAKDLIDSAAKTGCDAVKFQTYFTENRAPAGNQKIFEILKKCELPLSDFEILKQHSNKQNLDFFSTPFDAECVQYLNSIGVDLYKVASFDIVNKKLLRSVAQTKKPVIVSVGMSNINEIKEAYEILSQNSRLSILHCVSAYPTNETDANLGSISKLKNLFSDCVIGQSDHTNGIEVPLYAVAAGAQIIEKHFKIDDEMECVDSPVSITEKQMNLLVKNIRRLESIIGDEDVSLKASEMGSTIFRRPTK